MKIGVISDTHGKIYTPILDFISGCDEIWHCGDIGNYEIVDILNTFTTTRIVSGNIDDTNISKKYPSEKVFTISEQKILLMHNAGYPQKYSIRAKNIIANEKPGILVCGHTHILRVMYDHAAQLFYINPGAAGKFGFHTHITAIRFNMERGIPTKMEIFEVDVKSISDADFS